MLQSAHGKQLTSLLKKVCWWAFFFSFSFTFAFFGQLCCRAFTGQEKSSFALLINKSFDVFDEQKWQERCLCVCLCGAGSGRAVCMLGVVGGQRCVEG